MEHEQVQERELQEQTIDEDASDVRVGAHRFSEFVHPRFRHTLEEVMDYRTYCCAGAKNLVRKPSWDFLLKRGREKSPEIDIPSW